MNQDAISTGERPAWRKVVDYPLVAMLIALAVFMVGADVAGFLTNALPPLAPPLDWATVYKLMAIVVWIVLYKVAIRRLGEAPRDDLRWQGALRDTALGLLAGCAIMAAIVGVAALVDVYNIVGEGSLRELVPAIVSLALYPAVSEELLFRGILFRWIEEFGGSWAALLLTSAFFGLAHLGNPNASPVAAFAIAIEAGVLLGGVYMLTRSLWAPIGLHAAWNFTQGQVFDVPVSGLDSNGFVEMRLSGPELLSGGPFGLEASLIAVVIATAVGAWVVVLAVRKGRVVGPHWLRARSASRPGPQEPPAGLPS